jgi:hypothetical protein
MVGYSFEAIVYLRLMNQMICIRGIGNQMIPDPQESQSKHYVGSWDVPHGAIIRRLAQCACDLDRGVPRRTVS